MDVFLSSLLAWYLYPSLHQPHGFIIVKGFCECE